MKKILLVISLSFLSLSVLAATKLRVLNAVKSPEFGLATGSKVELQANGQTIPATFIGRMPSHPKFGEEILLLNELNQKIIMVDARGLNAPVSRARMQTLVDTIDQAGETCAAYAIYHLFKQIHSIGRVGNGGLANIFAQEIGRMKFLEEAITTYYMGRTFNLKTILGKYGKRLGFTCRERKFTDVNKAIDFIFSTALRATPVIMEFDIGTEMVTSRNPIVDFETNEKPDPRLWIPRKRGERNVGGHAIVAAAAFLDKGKKKVMVLDSNWNEPRVWDLSKYLTTKTAIDEMIFHFCE